MKFPRIQKKKISHGFLIGLAGFFLALIVSVFGWTANFEYLTWDWRVKALANKADASSDVALILIDQNSLKWAEKENGLSWPWPREMYKAVIEYCQESEVKSLAFDVIFTEPSKYGVEDDHSLASAIDKMPNFVMASQLSRSNGVSSLPANLDIKSTTLNYRPPWLVEYPQMVLPIEELMTKVGSISHVNSSTDEDGVNRRLAPCHLFDNYPVTVLGLSSYIAAYPEENLQLSNGSLSYGKKSIPLDKEGKANLRYHGPAGTFTTFSAASIIQSYLRTQSGEKPVVTKEELKGKHIFFGGSAPALHDQHNCPFGGKYPGVEVHATFLDNLLSNSFFKPVPFGFDYLSTLCFSLLCALCMMVFTSSKGQLLSSFSFIGISFVFPYIAAHAGFRVAMVMPIAATVASVFISLAFNYMTEGRQKRFIQYAFKHYLSKHVIDQLIENPEKLKLGGERSELSIFFSDLEGFTTISEKLTPETLIEVLNEYLSEMSDIILNEQGMIDKYEGDAIIAFWNAPVKVKDHAVSIVRAALGCQKSLAEMRDRLAEKTGMPLKMRIGIHTGPAVVGNMGAKERFDYTMLGDSVNLAARLEGVNKQFGTYTLISQVTKDKIAGAYPTRELGKVAVVGRNEPVFIYEPMFQEEFDARHDDIENFLKGLDLFYQEQVTEAKKVFEKTADTDPPSQKYAEKCQLILDGTSDAKDGVWIMTSK